MEGARKKFTEWGVIDQGFRSQLVAGGIVKPETGWDHAQKDLDVRTGLASKNDQQEGENSPGRGLVDRVFDLSHSEMRVSLSLSVPPGISGLRGWCVLLQSQKSW